MVSGNDALRALKEALKLSPENIPLRKHLADTLFDLGQFEEAENEYLQALRLVPEDVSLRTGLANALFKQGKNISALKMIEDLAQKGNLSPSIQLLYSRLLLRTGQSQVAAQAYRRAIEADPTIVAPDLARELGVDDESASEVVEGRVRLPMDESPDSPGIFSDLPKVNFEDVGGMDKIKEEIRVKIIYPLAHPEIYKAYGKAMGGGILLYGPPGCGKTHLARATAGEVQAQFIPVGIHDVLDMWIGQSERNLHQLFEQARAHKPCVLFFDEVDALGASRSDMRQSAGRHLINQFLSELDGIRNSNAGILVLGATNAPWHLDVAFRRPGRFDRIIFVPPPDGPAREGILRILCREKPVDELDYRYLAKLTEQFSGADLKAMVELAVEEALREAMKKGCKKLITTKDLATSAKSVRPSTKEWFATARNYALYSNDGGLYDDVLKYLNIR